MNIGIFTDTYLPDINGVVTSVVTLKKTLEAKGHTVYIVTNHDDLLKTTFKDNVLRLPALRLDFLYGYKLTNPIQITAAKPIKAWDLDLIHVHQEFGVGIFGRSIANAFNIPLVSTYHTTYEDYTHYINYFKWEKLERLSKKAVGGLSKTFTKQSNVVIAPSEKTKQLLISYGVDNIIEVVPTGLDLDKFDYHKTSENRLKEIRSESNISDDETVFIYLGRLAKEKSVDIVIKAFKILKDQNIKARFIIVGGGPERKSLEDLVFNLDLNDYVSFLGVKNSEDVPAYYHVADAFISASTTETQGLTYIEALASGLAVFAKRDKVLEDLVIENKTGFFFDDKEELAKKLTVFIKDKSNKERLRKNALEISQTYSLDNYYDNIIKCYNKAIEMDKDARNKWN